MEPPRLGEGVVVGVQRVRVEALGDRGEVLGVGVACLVDLPVVMVVREVLGEGEVGVGGAVHGTPWGCGR